MTSGDRWGGHRGAGVFPAAAHHRHTEKDRKKATDPTPHTGSTDTKGTHLDSVLGPSKCFSAATTTREGWNFGVVFGSLLPSVPRASLVPFFPSGLPPSFSSIRRRVTVAYQSVCILTSNSHFNWRANSMELCFLVALFFPPSWFRSVLLPSPPPPQAAGQTLPTPPAAATFAP